MHACTGISKHRVLRVDTLTCLQRLFRVDTLTYLQTRMQDKMCVYVYRVQTVIKRQGSRLFRVQGKHIDIHTCMYVQGFRL